MRDERDQLIVELSDIIGAEPLERSNGLVDVEAGGIAVVIATSPTEIEVGIMDNGQMGLSIKKRAELYSLCKRRQNWGRW